MSPVAAAAAPALTSARPARSGERHGGEDGVSDCGGDRGQADRRRGRRGPLGARPPRRRLGHGRLRADRGGARVPPGARPACPTGQAAVAAAAHRCKPPASPARDVLHGLLTTILRVDVPAALLRMPENASVRCSSARSRNWSSSWPRWDAMGPVTATLTPPSEQPEQPSRRRSPRGGGVAHGRRGALTAL